MLFGDFQPLQGLFYNSFQTGLVSAMGQITIRAGILPFSHPSQGPLSKPNPSAPRNWLSSTKNKNPRSPLQMCEAHNPIHPGGVTAKARGRCLGANSVALAKIFSQAGGVNRMGQGLVCGGQSLKKKTPRTSNHSRPRGF